MSRNYFDLWLKDAVEFYTELGFLEEYQRETEQKRCSVSFHI